MALPLDLGLLQSDKRFQEMCCYLARKKFPQAIPVAHGAWDGGRDIFLFADKQGDIVWQCKFTQRSLSDLKPKVVSSLDALNPSQPIAKWILCVSVEASGVFLDWLRAEVAGYGFIASWEVWDKQILLQQLDQAPDVLEMFFYPVWKALEVRFRTEELELVQYELDPDCGWTQPDHGILYFRRAGRTEGDLVLDIIVRSRGSLQSLLRELRLEISEVRHHLRGLPGTALLYAQHTYPISLRGGKPGVWLQKMKPPLVIDAGTHQRFKIRLTDAGYAWTGYIRLFLLYGDGRELPLPRSFLRP